MRRPAFCQGCPFMPAVLAYFYFVSGAFAQGQPIPALSEQKAALSRPESRAARAYDAAVRGGPLALHAFLDQFPKGADLHVHLSGAVYAETFIRDAAQDGVCVDAAALKFVKGTCGEALVPAARLEGGLAPSDQELYDRLINSFSMRSVGPRTGFSGHDQFFGTFGRYGGLDKRHVGEWVDEVASRAAAQNQQYLELMETPAFGHTAAI